ncbi:unnamed protein product [Rotaria sordida]|uniref:Endonuclease GajA/Old nuclease/RecF-like AAA domain-containing protein n=1 Tax=Rotaria sordida TaxID=392033 RepID=A0A815CM24_9BILA|nr:unnamed protein product [Rotaria sordida]
MALNFADQSTHKVPLSNVTEERTQRIRKIRECKAEINNEIGRIFPGIGLCYQEEILQQHPLWREYYGQNCNLEQQGTPILSTGLRVLSEHEKIGQTFENITPCGEGVLQCLTLIITICCAESNSIITIDEPDAHVFPNAQKLLINFFHHKLKEFSKSNRFCQMIITTHSTDIMQAVKPEEIRQLLPRSELGNPIEIKSLAHIGQLLNAMTDVGASILSHGEFVRLAIHRKLLYLENHDDYNFLNKLVDRSKPELLKLPFTIMGKGGRPHPLQVKQMLLQFGQFLPKETTLHIFILVDSDLRSRYILDKEEKEYKKIQADLYDPKNPKKQTIKVQLYYHCWAAREWENWLLSNENLLYKMICDDEIYHKDEAIKRIRDRIQQHQSMESIFPTSDSFQHDQPMITTTGGASNAPQYPIYASPLVQGYKELLCCIEMQ